MIDPLTCEWILRIGDTPCGRPPIQHVLLAMECAHSLYFAICEAHSARFMGDLKPLKHTRIEVEVHAFEDCCGMPGTIWDRSVNRCVIDDSGVEPQLKEQELAHA